MNHWQWLLNGRCALDIDWYELSLYIYICEKYSRLLDQQLLDKRSGDQLIDILIVVVNDYNLWDP